MKRDKKGACSHRYGWILAFIVLAGLTIRLLALQAWSRTPYWTIPIIDEGIYRDWAIALATGQYTSRTAYEFSPLPAILFAFLYRFFGDSLLVVRLANIAMGTGIIYVIASMARRVGGDRSGLLAGALAAFYMPFIFYSVTLLKETFSVFMFSLFILCLLKSMDSCNAIWCLLLGVVAALCLHIRGHYLVLLPVAFLAAVMTDKALACKPDEKWKRLLGCVLGTLLVLAPFVIRNALVAGDFVLSTTQGGFNFYLGNHDLYSTPYCRPTRFATPSPNEQGVHFTVEASRRTGKTLSSSQASIFWYRETFREMSAHPMFSLKKMGKKVLAAGNRFEACDHFDIPYLSQFAGFLKLPLPTFGLIFPLGVASLIVRLRDRRTRWLLLPLALYAATLVLFFTTGRYRLPLLVVLIPFAAVGLFDVTEALRAKTYRRAGFYFFIVVLASAFESLPLQGSTDLSAYRNAHGVVLDILGRKSGAVDCWNDSIERGGDFVPSACIELAKVECREGNLKAAEEYLALIPDRSYAQAPKLALLGQIRVIQHRWHEAAELLQQSMAINTADIRVRELLIGVLLLTDPSAAERERDIQERIRPFFR